MKIITVVGTRPELIRLSIIIEKLDKIVDHIFVYTNQNYDYNLSGQFFYELSIRRPDYYFTNEGHSIGNFLSNAILQFEEVILKEKPDKMLVLGDTNSGLLSIIAEKYKIPIYHMEAGNRCYDERVPEESNRRVIDTVSTYNLPYTENSKQNLLKEGYHKNFVFKIGNPIFEVLNYFQKEILGSTIINKLGIVNTEYVLVTAHRAESVDNETTLISIMDALDVITTTHPVIFPAHPRTQDKIKKFNIDTDRIKLINPVGFFAFVNLEQNAKVVISDSGTVQEECCIFNVPSITIRDSTERQETIECGSNILTGTDTRRIVGTFKTLLNRDYSWTAPQDYTVDNVSDIVINILLGV
jgi:UDP-N-acetylglucosamine 2-epimerase (non-hydrolysing)